MQRDSIEFVKIHKHLIDHGQVSYNVFNYTIRSVGYLVPLEFYFEELFDLVSFEKIVEEIEENIADMRTRYASDYDFEKALYVDISATESFYQVTMDLWFADFSEAIKVAEELDIPSEDIFSIADGCYIYDNEDD